MKQEFSQKETIDILKRALTTKDREADENNEGLAFPTWKKWPQSLAFRN